MLKITLDSTPIRDKPSGIGLYALNLIEELFKLREREELQLSLVFQPSVKNWLRGNLTTPEKLRSYPDTKCLPLPVSITRLLTRYPNPLIDYYGSYLGSPDILHGLDHVVYPRRGSKKVMTIHDLTFIKYPELVSSIVLTYTERIKNCLRWTDLIIANSESTKRDIIQYLDVEPEIIHVTPLASRYSDVRDTPSNPNPHPKPYILFVSTIEPRKNIVNLVRAFNILKGTYKIEQELILIGQKGWKYEPVFESIDRSSFKNQIHHLDYLDDTTLIDYYRNADVFVYPGLYEGFGLPVLEAMTLGCPVVTSDTSSLPEIAGDAAVLIEPREPEAIASGILKVISDSGFRRTLIEKGRRQASRFSWQNTALKTVKAYRTLF